MWAIKRDEILLFSVHANLNLLFCLVELMVERDQPNDRFSCSMYLRESGFFPHLARQHINGKTPLYTLWSWKLTRIYSKEDLRCLSVGSLSRKGRRKELCHTLMCNIMSLTWNAWSNEHFITMVKIDACSVEHKYQDRVTNIIFEETPSNTRILSSSIFSIIYLFVIVLAILDCLLRQKRWEFALF